MSNSTHADDDRHQEKPKTPERTTQQKDSVEDEPAVERGERIATGKAIARSGHEAGEVAGTDAQSPDKSPNKSAK